MQKIPDEMHNKSQSSFLTYHFLCLKMNLLCGKHQFYC